MPNDARRSQGVPSLFNGVSQQAPSLRLPSQATEQLNLFSSIVDGLAKRPYTEHIAKLRNSDSSDVHVHVIDRDETEQYVAILLDGDLEIYNIADGTAATINFPDGKGYLNTVGAPRSAFKAVTIADNTIIVNTETTATMDAAYVQETEVFEAVVHIDRGINGVSYSVKVAGTTYTYASATTSTSTIASGLAALLPAGTWNTTVTGSAILISRVDAADFTFEAFDSYGGQALTGAKGSVQRFEDLPTFAFNGFRVQVAGDPADSSDDYYVEYQNSSSGGVWVESRGYAIDNAFDAATMPHRLVNTSLNNFDFEQITWDDREVGDADSATEPGFIGNTINDVVYFRGRLGFLSDENIVLSKVGDAFDFWPSTVTDSLDTDPIDATVNSNKVSILKHAIPYNKSLLLFTDHTQFQLSADGVLSPSTVKVDPTTEFKSSPDVAPVAAGPNVYFAVKKGEYTGIREYFVSEDAVTNDAANVTGHVPRYLPKEVFRLDASSNEDMLVALSTYERQSMWVYKYFWVGEEKLQSSWSKWTFGDSADTKILNAAILGTKIYLVIQRNNEVFLESMDIQFNQTDTGLDYRVHLDRRNELTGVYDAGNDWTTWTLPFDDTSSDLKVVLGSAFTGQVGARVLNTTRPTDSTIRVTGDYSAGAAYVGRSFTSSYTVSRQYIREGGEGSKAIITGVLQLHRMLMVYTNSGTFKATVSTPGNESDYEYEKTPTLGSSSYLIGSNVVDSGEFSFPVQARSDKATVTFINDGYTESYWQSLEWIGSFDPLEERA